MRKVFCVHANCQGGAIIRLLRLHSALAEWEFVHLRSWTDDAPTPDQRDRCRAALRQRSPRSAGFPADLPAAARIVTIPTLTCPHLWPYAFDRPDAPAGWRFPYGDRFLIARIKEGASPDEAAAAYWRADLAQTFDLERLRDIEWERMRREDRENDVKVADFLIEKRNERLFLTPDHPTDRVLLHMVNQVLALLGLRGFAEPDWSKHVDSLYGVDVPVHPSVARRLGVSHIGEDGPHCLFGGWAKVGAYEYYRRYAGALLRPTVDDGLAEALAGLGGGKVDDALNIASLVLMRRPGEPRALSVAAVAHALAGRAGPALETLAEVVSSTPAKGDG